MNKQETIKCPFCAEEILSDAKKCKHCGEWLDVQMQTTFNTKQETINPDVIAKGIEKAEINKTAMGCLGIVVISISVIIGFFTHWLIGLIVFVGICMWVGTKYHK